jgi:hypothetical protein
MYVLVALTASREIAINSSLFAQALAYGGTLSSLSLDGRGPAQEIYGFASARLYRNMGRPA